MKGLRVLLISNVRPSRTWNFANRLVSEIPGAEVCGIIQRSMRSIPRMQRMIAEGKTRAASAGPGSRSKAWLLIRSMLDIMADWFFWFVHGCPSSVNHSRFTIERLASECSKNGWPLAVITKDSMVSLEAPRHRPLDLVILLGEFSSIPGLSAQPSTGYIRACNHSASENGGEPRGETLISIEHLPAASRISSTIVSLTLPWQPFDGPLGFALKTDLITDDLLLQTAGSLLAGDAATASTLVSQWANRTLTPCLSQLDGLRDHVTLQKGQSRKRCRSTWKLCLDTAVLLFPTVMLRNWSRRLTGRYPVHILALHLISDRPHRMGVSTETFWRVVLFLKKHYRIVSLSEGVELLRSGQIRVPTVVLTFDDGYADNFLSLRAVATEAEIPSTLFVTTGHVETHRAFEHDLAKGMTDFFPLTWDQIQYWSTRGAEFGSHTRTHFDCGSVDSENLQSEILGSKNDLEAHLKKSVDFFAFPYGQKRNMSSEAMRLAASTYAHYVSCFGGESLVKTGEIQSHLLRKKFYGSPWELALELQSVFDFVDAIKRRFLPHSANSSNISEGAPAVSPPLSSVRPMGAQSAPSGIYSRAKSS